MPDKRKREFQNRGLSKGSEPAILYTQEKGGEVGNALETELLDGNRNRFSNGIFNRRAVFLLAAFQKAVL